MIHLLCRYIIPSLMKTPHELCLYKTLKEFNGIQMEDFYYIYAEILIGKSVFWFL